MLQFTSVGKNLPVAGVDVGQPLRSSRLIEANGGALAIVKDVRHLEDDEVREFVVFGKALGRAVAGGFFAKPDKAKGVIRQQCRTGALQIQVSERPCGAVEFTGVQQILNVRASYEDNGLLNSNEYGFLFRSLEQATHHRLDFRAREGDGVDVGQRVV